jgi:catechol 2,3-dioxygenase-like lactoylglutathione lyase family enzyme/predicted enzyme related to lactoylglutathione lyase
MNMKRRFFFILALVTIFLSTSHSAHTQPPRQVKPSLITLQVSSLDRSISWYKEMLGFEMDNRYTYIKQKTKIAVLKLKDFYIELIQNTASTSQTPTMYAVPDYGYYKMGFLVTGFDDFYQELKQKHPDQVNGVISSEVNGYTYFDLYDPDSTLIQIIASAKSMDSLVIRPYIIGIKVSDMESEINWYEQNLDLTFTRKWEVADRGIYVRQLYADGFIIELQKETSGQYPLKESGQAGINKEMIRGICKMTLQTDNIQSLCESLKTHHSQILQDITPKSAAWYTSFLVTEDTEKNTIQIIQ